MGYTTYLRGQIDIEPALTAAQIRELQLPDDVALEVTQETQPVDDGELTVRRGVALKCAREDEFRAYDFKDDITAAVAAVRALAPESALNGVILAEGEDNADIWRVRVADSVVHIETAKVVWPDGTEHRR